MAAPARPGTEGLCEFVQKEQPLSVLNPHPQSPLYPSHQGQEDQIGSFSTSLEVAQMFPALHPTGAFAEAKPTFLRADHRNKPQKYQ